MYSFLWYHKLVKGLGRTRACWKLAVLVDVDLATWSDRKISDLTFVWILAQQIYGGGLSAVFGFEVVDWRSGNGWVPSPGLSNHDNPKVFSLT